MDNHSFNERHSLTGNSGLLGLTNLRTKLQPVRVQQLLEMFGSDEEDSEEKGRDSDDESDCEDVQPLSDDDAELQNASNQEPKDSNEIIDNDKISTPSHVANKKITSEQIEQQNPIENSPPREETTEKHSYASENMHFTSNFVSDNQSHMKLENHRSESLPSESGASGYFSRAVAPKSLIETNRRSNVSLKLADALHPSIGKSSYALVSSKSESAMQSINSTVKSKFEAQESNFFSSDRHLQHAASQAESSATNAGSTNVQSANYLTTDTPHKNNPHIGSMRPTPSMSHRSMFQTPQNTKLHHQDYSKNHVQTPATIFGNWSQKHMAQTPMQSRSTILPSDSSRAQIPPNVVTQNTVATPGSINETPWYQNSEKKNVRRPLTETMASINHKRHSQSDKPTNAQYAADLPATSSKHRDNCSPENPQSRGVLEDIKEQSSNKSGHQLHESKENRRPTPVIDKLLGKEDEQRKKDNFEGNKESESLSFNGNIPNENRPDATRHRVENSDAPSSQTVRRNSSATPKNTMSRTVVDNNGAPKQQANVQLSIPSSIRRANSGETMIIKGKEYLILGGLGQGMSCHVLRVQDLTNLELRAIKVVNLSRMEKESVQGCVQEISMLHKLQAPCVVRMFDYEIKYPMVHVVMEMGDTDFKSLLSSMTESKRLPLTMILYYWTEMLTAVKHIHDHGVIHSDLKPANFLLVRGRLKLIDFGIASSINADMTSVVKNSPIGTLNYISPEALLDIGGGSSDSPNHNVKYKITFKSDVWSLGCILYSLVYGYTPFNNYRTQWAKIQAITNPNPKISFTLPAGNDVEQPPAILIDVLRKCLQHDPKARPTVTQLLQIPYLAPRPNPHAPLREIPSNIVLKIRHSLTDDEWRQFKEVMDQ